MTTFEIIFTILIVSLSALVIYVLLRPFIYTLTKCKGIKKFIGLKYASINLLVFIVCILVTRPLEKIFTAIGGDIGKDLAALSNIAGVAIPLYISLGIMKKTKTYVEKLNDRNNNNQQ